MNIKSNFRLLLFARYSTSWAILVLRSRNHCQPPPTWKPFRCIQSPVCTFYFRQSRNRNRAKVSNIAAKWRRSRRCRWLKFDSRSWAEWPWPVDRSHQRRLATGSGWRQSWRSGLVYDKGATSGIRTGHRPTRTTAHAATRLREVSLRLFICSGSCLNILSTPR